MIVPVWLHHHNNPENKTLVYALLNDQSYTTFVAQSMVNQLGILGHKTTILLSTMHTDSELIESHKVNGLVINNFYHDIEIQLPRTFSCSSIPVKRCP